MKELKSLRAHIVTACRDNYVELIILSDDKTQYHSKRYTLKSGIVTDEMMKHADENNRAEHDDIYLINALTNKLEKMNLYHVIQMRVLTKEDDENYNSTEFEDYKSRLDYAMTAVDKAACNLTEDELMEKYQMYKDSAFKMMSIFDHLLDDSEVLNPTIELSGNKLNQARACWIKLLRKYRLAAFEELDELEKTTTDRDELEDIDTIKQMFRDIPQDVDLSKLTTVEQIVNFWPPLLLPVPKEVDEYRKYVHDQKQPGVVIDDDVSYVIDCLEFVGQDQLDELIELHGELKNIHGMPEQFLKLVQDKIDELK